MNKIYRKCFPARGWRVVEKVAPIARKHGAILAGGTALALQIGHRESVDLDFFTNRTFSVDETVFALGQAGLSLKILNMGENHVVASLDEVKFSLFTYQYPFVTPVVHYRALSVAGIPDIAAMKVIAISQHGTRRDFIDLYYIIQQLPMHVIAGVMTQKYGKDGINAIHIGKSLVYFADADGDYDPKYLEGKQLDWEQVKAFFRKNIKSLVSSLSAIK